MPDANDLSLEEWKAVVALLPQTIATDKFPFSDRMRVLRSALQKLDPASAPKPRKELPPLPTGPMVGSRRKRGGRREPVNVSVGAMRQVMSQLPLNRRFDCSNAPAEGYDQGQVVDLGRVLYRQTVHQGRLEQPHQGHRPVYGLIHNIPKKLTVGSRPVPYTLCDNLEPYRYP
jgi:hypothetical protein